MGWTFTSRRRGVSHLEFFSALLNCERGRVLDAAGIGFSEVYVAYETLDPQTGARLGIRRCWARIHKRDGRPRFRVGDLVLFPRPLLFSTGEKLFVLQVAASGHRLRFSHPVGGYERYKVRNDSLEDVQVIAISDARPRRTRLSLQLEALVATHGLEKVTAAYRSLRGNPSTVQRLCDAVAERDQAAQGVAALIAEALTLGEPQAARASAVQQPLPG